MNINWGQKIINVYKADLVLVQSNPTVIYDMDLNWFHLALKDLEDSEEGMSFLDTHRHNTEVTLGGLTFARVVEIINDYTITFEDDQYAVNLVGANSNVAEKTNVNQVSLRSNNSAGLIVVSGSGSAPTVQQIRIEMDTNSTQLQQILNDLISKATKKDVINASQL